MTCYANRRSETGDGWICTGEDLTIVAPATNLIPPLVIRRDLLPTLLTDRTYRSIYEQFADLTGPFLAGGDHLHAALPDVPRWRRVLLRLGVGS